MERRRGVGSDGGIVGPGRFELPTSRLSGVRSNQAELRAPKKIGARSFRSEGGSGAGRTPSYGRGAARSSFLGTGDSALELVISRRVSFSIGIDSCHQQVDHDEPNHRRARSRPWACSTLGQRGSRSKLRDRGAWARVELAKHRPLQGRCFTELAPEAGARLNYRPHAYQACALTRLSYGPLRRPARDRFVRDGGSGTGRGPS